jgi:hypothetical protein
LKVVSKKIVAENNVNKLTQWLRHTADEVKNIHTAFTIERKIVHPVDSAQNRTSSNIKANIHVERLFEPLSKKSEKKDFKAQGQIEYQGQEENSHEQITRTIVFFYNSATKEGHIDMNKKETNLGSFQLNAMAKGWSFLNGGKLSFSLKEILEQRLNPRDKIQQLIHQLLFFGNTPIPDTSPWKLPEVFENLSSTVTDPEHDFARFDTGSLSVHIKNGFESKANFELKNSQLFLKSFKQKQPLYKVAHPDFDAVPYRESVFEAQVTFFNIP